MNPDQTRMSGQMPNIPTVLLVHGGRPARVEAMTADGQVIPLAMSLGVLTGPTNEPDGAVAVLRHATI
jgi:hypothetical protein